MSELQQFAVSVVAQVGLGTLIVVCVAMGLTLLVLALHAGNSSTPEVRTMRLSKRVASQYERQHEWGSDVAERTRSKFSK